MGHNHKTNIADKQHTPKTIKQRCLHGSIQNLVVSESIQKCFSLELNLIWRSLKCTIFSVYGSCRWHNHSSGMNECIICMNEKFGDHMLGAEWELFQRPGGQRAKSTDGRLEKGREAHPSRWASDPSPVCLLSQQKLRILPHNMFSNVDDAHDQ